MSKRKIATVGDCKIYRDSEWDEYIVVDQDGNKYHTDDKGDALITAEWITNRGSTNDD